GAVAETLKYSTKPADMVADPDWFLGTGLNSFRTFIRWNAAFMAVSVSPRLVDSCCILQRKQPRAVNVILHVCLNL
ncbi:hypothetical protein QU698_25415, partial [Enterobacter hormaechei subsp. xiangfangensis]|nr:hypothetical protein [Enterobacter hormaechei subsp. xiangfangensis]